MSITTRAATLEVAILNVLADQTQQFEVAFRQAEGILTASDGYITHELQRCVEMPNRYVLLVRWKSLASHTEGFRRSPGYQEWKCLLHHFYDPFPTVEHYQDIAQGTDEMSDQDVADSFLAFSRERLLNQYWPRLRTCVESLTDEQVWWRPNEETNSIGNLLLHLNGNVQQWIVASFEHLDDNRNRPAEFSERQNVPASVLLEQLGTTMQLASGVLARLAEADLRETFEIQGYTVSGLRAVYQVVEHFALHYGQIAYATKSLRAVDLGFHRELDKTGRA